jgi:protein transport protein SEC24
VKAHYGNFLERSITDIQFGILDADKSIYASLDFTSTLDSLGAMTMDTISSLLAQTRIQSFQSQNEGSPALLEHQKQKHRQALSTQKQAYFQSATLYTTVEGERRVRVCNLSLPVVSLAGNVYRYGDCEAVTAALAKTGELLHISCLKRGKRKAAFV